MRSFAEEGQEDGARRWAVFEKASLPFGYRAFGEGWLVFVRRPDGSFVAAFPADDADPFEVEAAVWEDAD